MFDSRREYHFLTVVSGLLLLGSDIHRQETRGNDASERFSDRFHGWNRRKKVGIQPDIQT
jgi:hypothetical protein